MADNVDVVASVATYKAAADELTYSGDTAMVQLTRLVHVSGSEGSKTLTEIVGTIGSPSTVGLTIQQAAVSTKHVIAAATDNAQSVKASAGLLRAVRVYNNADYPIYVKFHNTAGTPTAGASVVYTVGVQAGTQRDVVLPGGGRAFATGIGLSVVKGLADNDATATAASDAAIEVEYV